MCDIQDALAAAMGMTAAPANPQSLIPSPARETNAAYHADTTHVGSTMIRKYAVSPAWFRDLYVTRTLEPKPQSPPMILGSLMHCEMEGEDRWREEFLLADGCDSRRSKLWTGWAEEAAARGLTPILPAQLAAARGMAAAIRSNPTARQFIEAAGPVERTIRWQHECGLRLKCKLDKVLFGDDADTAIDLKSSADPRPSAFPWAVKEYRYDLQAALYLDGLATLGRRRPADFVFITVRNVAPFRPVCCYVIDRETLDAAREELDGLYHRLQRSYTTNDWTAPEELQLNVLRLPGNGKPREDVTLIIDDEEVSL